MLFAPRSLKLKSSPLLVSILAVFIQVIVSHAHPAPIEQSPLAASVGPYRPTGVGWVVVVIMVVIPHEVAIRMAVVDVFMVVVDVVGRALRRCTNCK